MCTITPKSLLLLAIATILLSLSPYSLVYADTTVTDGADTACSADIYPIDIFTTSLPFTRTWKLGTVTQYTPEAIEAASMIRFAVDYINQFTTIIPNCSLELYEADAGLTTIPQSTNIASVAEIIMEGVRGMVGGNTAEIMRSSSQASTDFLVPHIGSLIQDYKLGIKTTYPYMMRAIPSYREHIFAMRALFLHLGWYGGEILATSDEYGTDAGNYVLGSTELKAIPFKFKQQQLSLSQSDFAKKGSNFLTEILTFRVVTMFTTPETGFAFLKYINQFTHNATIPPIGVGISYVLTQAMCKPLLEGNATFREYYPLIDGSICMYPRGADNESTLYHTLLNAWNNANQTQYPGARPPSSFNWYGVDSVFAHAYAIGGILRGGTQITNVGGAAYLNALKNVKFNGTTGPFSFDATYDRQGVWDIYNNIYHNDTGVLEIKWVGVYRWSDNQLYTESDFVFYGGSTIVNEWNATAPAKNTTAAPTIAPTPPPPVIREYRPQFAGGLAVILGICTIIAIFAAFVLAFSWGSFARHGPFYCSLIIAGVFLSFASGLTLLPEPTDRLCLSFPWLLGFAFNLVYGCLFIKTWVLYSVFRKAAKLKKTNLTPFHILKLISLFLAVEAVLMLTWTFVDPPTVRRVDLVDHSYEYQCQSDTSIFWIVFLAYKGAWLIFGSILSFLTRNMAEEYNESKSIAYAIYADIALIIIAVPLAISIQDIQGGVTAVEVAVIAISFTFTMVVLFWQVWFNIFFGTAMPPAIDLSATRSTGSKSTHSHSDSSRSPPGTPPVYSKNRTPPPAVSSSGLYLA